MLSSLRLSVRFLLAWTLLVGIPGGAGRSVLCFGPNDHVAIEAGEGRCADNLPSAADAIDDPSDGTLPEDCGDCVDLPIGKHAMGSLHHGTAAAKVAAPASSAAMASGQAGAFFATDYRSPMAHCSPARPSFPPSRTTILRI